MTWIVLFGLITFALVLGGSFALWNSGSTFLDDFDKPLSFDSGPGNTKTIFKNFGIAWLCYIGAFLGFVALAISVLMELIQ